MLQYKKFNFDFRYLFAEIICLFFVMTRFFWTDFFDNEWVYSINPIKILHPNFLANDFFLQKGLPIFLFNDVITSPFYYFFDFLTAVLILRILLWIFQIWALSSLTKTLGITWWGFILLIILWLNVEQTLVAGEWIIGSLSAKPVSYGFIFLALNSFLKHRLKWSGIFCGLAISFHVLVGLWCTMALFFAIIFTYCKSKNIEVKKVSSFCVAVVVLSLPGLIPAIYYEFFNQNMSISSLEVSSDVARVSVLFANPFHLDPKYFITGLEYLKVGLFSLLSILMVNYLLPKEKAHNFVFFILFLCIFFISGLVARYLEWYHFLKYYPFRVADAFVPLSFWMGFVLLFHKLFYMFHKTAILLLLLIPIVIGGVNYLNDQCEPNPQYHVTLKSFSKSMLRTEPRLTAYWIRERGKEWHTFLFARKLSDIEKIELWIKENTPKDSVFIIPPWEMSFFLKAQRSQFVSFKYVPANQMILEWKERMETLNRGRIRKVGWGILQELRENYPKLTEKEVIQIKEKKVADYFLTTSDVHLNLELVHENNSYRLYGL